MRILFWIGFSFHLLACGPTKTAVQVESQGSETIVALSSAQKMVKDLSELHFDKLGNPVLRWDHIPAVLATREKPHKLLVLLVEYSDRKFDRFQGDADQGSKLKEYYQSELFDDKYQKIDTLSHYYRTQSLGKYHLIGEVMEPIVLPHSREYYGAPHRPAGGNWRNDSSAEALVADALQVAQSTYKDMNWEDFDRWDPEDIDSDKNLDEGDGYLDHFVIVFAGGGQSSCEGLYKIRDILTPNVQMKEGLALLNKQQKDCANRIWPHRSKVKANDGQGPKKNGIENPAGGIPVLDSLWVKDYNMQSEYTGPSTFIHEFGHSIGLPDVYSRTSSNSTGGWEVMSGTASPSPQNMSSWSRLMLGWLKPNVVVPPAFGGSVTDKFTLRTLDDPTGEIENVHRATMVVLPPKEKHIQLTDLPSQFGNWALYSGQGNDLNRKAQFDVDLTGVSSTQVKKSGAVELSFDAWWEIEAAWDFAYLEISSDEGRTWTRKRPTNLAFMPAKHGHDGKTTEPGFTGISGDLDGDGKNESQVNCDPKVELPHGEDKKTEVLHPCLTPSWVHPVFDLSSLAGKKIKIRLRYYTDGAAVMRGIMIDNVQVTQQFSEGFEKEDLAAWTLEGFSKSNGTHNLLVPHFYLMEYRDPYAKNVSGEYRYDSALAQTGTLFYANPKGKEMMAVQVKSRPGVVLWYYNGAYAWSENDPSINGPGQGYLLAVDSHTSEIKLPGLASWMQGSDAANDTHYKVDENDAQTLLKAAYEKTVCFVRNPSYLPVAGVSAGARKKLQCGKKSAAMGAIAVDGKPLQYSYQVYNELLPGKARKAFTRAGELIDTRTKKGILSYRLRDRSLRSLHTKDAPFSAEEFRDGIVSFKVLNKNLEQVETQSYAAVSSFDDTKASRYLNAKLPFGGVLLPQEGFSFIVKEKRQDKSGNTLVDVEVEWK